MPKSLAEVLITFVLVVEKADAVSWVFREKNWGAYPLIKDTYCVRVFTISNVSCRHDFRNRRNMRFRQLRTSAEALHR